MTFLRNAKVMNKLLLMTGVMCLIVVAVGVVATGEVSDMRRLASDMYKHELLGVAAAKDVRAQALTYMSRMESAVAHPESVGQVRKSTATVRQSIRDALTQLASSAGTESIGTDEDRVRASVPLMVQAGERLLGAIERADGGEVANAEATLLEQVDAIDSAVAALAAERLDRAEREHIEAGQIYDESQRFMLGFIGAALLLGFLLALVVARMISTPLQQTVRVLEGVADGDLTEVLPEDRQDELGRMAVALNRAMRSMRDTLREVRTAAASVAGTANELTAASQDISSGAQEQASGLEEASASLEEMAEAIKQNAAGAERASGVSAESRSVAMRGSEVVAEAVEAMTSVDAASQQIAQIIGTIDEIAFQTNLLALNAAVEAARAGDQGRGFAVVASEVRNLAQRSASAAKEIKELIGDSTRRVEAGSRLVNESGKSLNEILDSVGRVSDLVQEIAAASKEQSIGVGHVNTAVMQADRVTQANAAQTEELSGSAEALSGEQLAAAGPDEPLPVGSRGNGGRRAAAEHGGASFADPRVERGSGACRWSRRLPTSRQPEQMDSRSSRDRFRAAVTNSGTNGPVPAWITTQHSERGRACGLPIYVPTRSASTRKLLRDRVGIFLSASKAQLLISRLAKRLRERACPDLEAYYELVTSGPGHREEFQAMVNRITTNKTDFFREAHHFEALAAFVKERARTGPPEPLRIWSAGCSTGEEPYTIALVLQEALSASEFARAEILATDIDTEVLQIASRGVYADSRLAPIPQSRWRRSFLRGTGRWDGTVKAGPALRDRLRFEVRNLIDPEWCDEQTYDVVFCRNTLIYFDRPTQREIVQRLAASVRPGGLLILGHSENLLGDEPGVGGRRRYDLPTHGRGRGGEPVVHASRAAVASTRDEWRHVL